MFVPLMEHMVDHVHTSWQVAREWHGNSKFAEIGEVTFTICAQISFCIRNDDSQDTACSEHTQTVFQERRQFFPRLQMFEKVFDSQPRDGAVRKGKLPAAIPCDNVRTRYIKVQVEK